MAVAYVVAALLAHAANDPKHPLSAPHAHAHAHAALRSRAHAAAEPRTPLQRVPPRRTATEISPNPQLLAAAAEAVAVLLRSPSHNLKYVGLTGLAAITR